MQPPHSATTYPNFADSQFEMTFSKFPGATENIFEIFGIRFGNFQHFRRSKRKFFKIYSTSGLKFFQFSVFRVENFRNFLPLKLEFSRRSRPPRIIFSVCPWERVRCPEFPETHRFPMICYIKVSSRPAIHFSYFTFCGYLANVFAKYTTKYKTLTVHFSYFIRCMSPAPLL